MQISYEEATSEVGLKMFFGALALFLMLVFSPLVLWLAEQWDRWRAARRRKRPYRSRNYADP